MTTLPQRGSVWRRWDLHVHTPASILNNQFASHNGEPDWDAYVQALEESGLAVVGVTDYFTIDGYRKLLEYKANGRLEGITILPNVEFRIDQVLVRNGGSPIHLNLHVLFSDELSPDLVEEHFLHDLRFTAEGRPQDPPQQRKLKRSNLQALGEDLQREHASFRGKNALEVGATQAVVSLKDISETLAADDRFRGKYLIALAEAGTSDISWDGQDHNVRKVLLQASDVVFSSNPKSRAWCLGEPPYADGPEKFVEEFQSRKACIHGSDAHDLRSIGKPCIRRGEQGHNCAKETDCAMRNCWIKADPTFEGLRQLLYEPDTRVRIQEGNPSPVQSPHSITGFTVRGLQLSPELTLAETALQFNPQLVAVVGGRGGGKTALVDLIANCYADRVDCEDPNSFVKRIADGAPPLTVELTLANGDTFTKEVTDGSVYEDSELVYIAQGELEAQVTDATALTAQIDAMILGSAAVADTVKRYELDQAAKRIEELTRQLEVRNKEVVRVEALADPTRRNAAEVAIKKKKADIEDIEKRIVAARGRLSPERATEAETQQKELAKLRDTAQKQAHLKELLAAADEVIRESAEQMGSVIDEINEQLKALSKKESLPSFRYAGTAKLEALREEFKTESATTAATIEQRSKALAALASEQEGLARALDLKKKAEGDLERLAEQLAVVTKADGQLEAAKTARSETLRNLAQAILDRRQQYKDVIALFSEKRDRLLSDLSFSAEVLIDDEELRARAEELLDGRTARLRATGGTPGELDRYVLLARELFASETPDIEAFVTEANALVERLKPKLKETRAQNPASIHELIFRNYFHFKPSVQYKRLPLGKLSLGQKATVLIKIHLADGTKPIILDSHDDHLDNEFIMDELVEGIRQAKEYRQVILVSNNGNVVVNSDAEQVIIAEREGTTIAYRTGSLEDPQMRDRLVSVLEGGRAAFNQRGRKYRLQA